MGELQLEMCYYNEKLAVWEPLLEPVMDTEDNYRPWEILIKVQWSWMCKPNINGLVRMC